MSLRAKEAAKKGIIDGKPLKEWLDAPAGAFAKAVRETGVDQFFGLRDTPDPDGDIKTFRVRVCYSYQPEREYSSKTYTVEAADAEQAEELAEEMFENDDDIDADDPEISDIDEPEVV